MKDRIVTVGLVMGRPYSQRHRIINAQVRQVGEMTKAWVKLVWW